MTTNPSLSICDRVRRECCQSALELDNGSAKTLALGGFAAIPPKVPKPLMPDRTNLPSRWTDTACIAIRSGIAVRLQRPGEHLTKKNSQILWLISDLEKFCSRI